MLSSWSWPVSAMSLFGLWNLTLVGLSIVNRPTSPSHLIRPVFESNQDYRSTELSTMLSHNSSTLNRWFEPHTPLFPALLSTYLVVAPELIRPACLMYGLWRSFQVLRKPLSSFLLSPYVGRLPSQIGHSSPYCCDHSFLTTLLRWVYIMYSYLYHT